MSKNQEFSALISVYGRDNLNFLKQAYESLLNQSVLPSEIFFIVDGPVPPDMRKFILACALDPRVTTLFLPVNMGRGAALEIALPKCKHELVALVDADDINLLRRFELLLNAFEADTALCAAGGQIEEFASSAGKKTAARTVPLKNEEIYKFVKSRSPLNQATVMLKKSAVAAAGGYKPFYLLEDYYLWGRMVKQGLKIRNMPEVLVLVRVGDEMFKRRGGWKYFKSNKALQDKFLDMQLISLPEYLFNTVTRFTVQVLMPNSLRTLFYKKILRKNG